jgi:dTDP-4-dehydrorhamnose reductase
VTQLSSPAAMRWLVTGSAGLLGTDLAGRLRSAGHDVLALRRADLDIRDARSVRAVIGRHRPDVVVNCAAWTDVDGAEDHEADALSINGAAVAAMAAACARQGCALVQVSTDAVFDGTAAEPYPEDASPAPVNAYGRSKLAGERAVLREHPGGGYVVRTAWLYGASGRSFAATMLRSAAGPGSVSVVADEVGQPTWAADAAEQIVRLVRAAAPPGIYHATNAGRASRLELAREIFALAGADPGRVLPVAAAAYPRAARRPAQVVLGQARWAAIGVEPMRHWRAALRRALPVLAAGTAGTGP